MLNMKTYICIPSGYMVLPLQDANCRSGAAAWVIPCLLVSQWQPDAHLRLPLILPMLPCHQERACLGILALLHSRTLPLTHSCAFNVHSLAIASDSDQIFSQDSPMLPHLQLGVLGAVCDAGSFDAFMFISCRRHNVQC